MTMRGIPLVVRPCGLSDVSRVRVLLRECWHSTYDALLGPEEAKRTGRRAYSLINLGAVIARSLLSPTLTVLIAVRDGAPVGYACAQRDGAEVILYGLYVHPSCKSQGIGSALLEEVITRYAGVKAIRLEVLKGNSASIAWYQAKGFVTYGDTPRATGTAMAAALYMDKQL